MKNSINKSSQKFLEAYLNNTSPTGFESKGQQMWLDYIRPNIDEYFTDNYGTVVGVINPKRNIKLLLRHMQMKFHGLCTTSIKTVSFT